MVYKRARVVKRLARLHKINQQDMILMHTSIDLIERVDAHIMPATLRPSQAPSENVIMAFLSWCLVRSSSGIVTLPEVIG
jgi:hypothetical protein